MNAIKLITLSLASCTFILSGCAIDGKVTGGGTMASISGTGKAVLAFNANSCGGSVSGQFNFHDKNYTEYPRGVKMHGDIVGADRCVAEETAGSRENAACETSFDENPPGCMGGYVVTVKYRSTNSKARGAGRATVCVIDHGRGARTSGMDEVWLRVNSGPYAGYFNKGKIKGNIQSHECDSTSSEDDPA